MPQHEIDMDWKHFLHLPIDATLSDQCYQYIETWLKIAKHEDKDLTTVPWSSRAFKASLVSSVDWFAMISAARARASSCSNVVACCASRAVIATWRASLSEVSRATTAKSEALVSASCEWVDKAGWRNAWIKDGQMNGRHSSTWCS